MNSDASDAPRGWRPDALFSLVSASVAAGYAIMFTRLLLAHSWILDANGKPIVTDFLSFWVAGRTALAGAPGAVYHRQLHHAAQVAAIGHPFHGYLVWNYPPLFLFVAVLLASVPYLAAFLGWLIATGAAYAATVGGIVKRRQAVLAACAAPAILFNSFPGQNGFLTAALMGAALLLLDRRPILSGIFLGLMTYKPQFGILFPIVLAVAGHWRVLAAATMTALTSIAASWLAFGGDAFRTFLHSLPAQSHTVLTNQGEEWSKMQSIYTVARMLGAGDSVGWIAQSLAILACLGTMIWLWRRDVSPALKTAGLAAASMLATPWLHVYDFPVLIVALAFLYRDRAFDRVEWQVVVMVNLLFFAFLLQVAPIGPGIVLLVLVLVLRRARLPQTVAEALGKWTFRSHARIAQAAHSSFPQGNP